MVSIDFKHYCESSVENGARLLSLNSYPQITNLMLNGRLLGMHLID